MTPAELSRMLRDRRVPPLLLLHGEETFLLERAVREIRESVVPPEARDFNYQVFRGRELQARLVVESVRTLPVFHPRRLVLVREVEEIPAGELERLAVCLEDPSPETVLVLTAEKIDGRKKFFQTFKKKGELLEFKRLYPNQIPSFVREQARAAGREFTEEALALFCRRVGNNLQEVHGELTKLFSYLGAQNLADVKDVAAVVSDTRVDSIFDLTNAIGEGRRAEALLLLERLLQEGQAPLGVLAMMVRHFRQLWKTRELLEQKEPKSGIARRVGINPYFVDGLVAQARHFGGVQYRRIFELFLETDMALKSNAAHPAARLENLVLEIIAVRKN